MDDSIDQKFFDNAGDIIRVVSESLYNRHKSGDDEEPFPKCIDGEIEEIANCCKRAMFPPLAEGMTSEKKITLLIMLHNKKSLFDEWQQALGFTFIQYI